ncbi:MAG: bifunctional riboflavin kinase/FAD synthetase [Actinomycetes bacterium]|jgi:riboflavin kinase/FMN adenylyltransferase|nr:bifunctional riboflavin kinase/FAD synthetase [Acidimicrobiia bacterium]
MNVFAPTWEVPDASGVAVGVFDGVHRGHVTVIAQLLSRCRKEGLVPGVLTFDPHPVEVLAPAQAPPLLTRIDRRIELLRQLGVEWVGVLDLRDIRSMSPEEFVTSVLIAKANVRLVSVGLDFRFGRDRTGDVATLDELGRRHGFDVAAVELVADEEGVISSTRIRQLVMAGRVSEAAALLGRPHRVSGVVVRGDARGRTLGYPTANLPLPAGLAVPADGIYAVRVRGAIEADGVASLGVRPTFGTSGVRLLEVHVFDFSGDLYGKTLDVDFVERLRGEERFDSVEALVDQMDKDAMAARQILSS